MNIQGPHCARCEVSAADCVLIGFVDGEVYCLECLNPEQVEMILGFAAFSAEDLERGA